MAPGTVPAGALTSKQATNDMRPADVAIPASGPGWMELTAAQKLALRPLAERWSFLSELQKRRWLVLAQSFAGLPASEQAKLHERMTEWANLSAQQRNQARLNFATANKLAPDNKRAQWEAYQALSSEEKTSGCWRHAPPHRRCHGAATGACTQTGPGACGHCQRRQPAEPPKIPPPPSRIVRPAPPPPATDTRTHTAEPVVVETAPISVPTATPLPLPPLPSGSAPAGLPPPSEPDSPNFH